MDSGGRWKNAPAFSTFTTSLWLGNAGAVAESTWMWLVTEVVLEFTSVCPGSQLTRELPGAAFWERGIHAGMTALREVMGLSPFRFLLKLVSNQETLYKEIDTIDKTLFSEKSAATWE